MRAVVVREHGAPDSLRVEEIPDPVPGTGEVRVRVRATALNHLDLWIRQGVPGAHWTLPRVTGADVAGEIESFGPGVGDVSIGTPVMVLPGISCGTCHACVSGEDQLCPRYGILGETRDGGLAELVVVPRANVVQMPPRFDFPEAAAMSLTWLTAWHMLVRRARVRPGETVLVQAAGSGIGVAAIQIARFLGARVLATAGSDEKRRAALQLGAEQALDYRSEAFAREVKSLTSGRGADIVVEHVGGETFERSLRALAWGGRVVTCGASSGVDVRVNLRHLFFKSQSILGSTMGSKGEYHDLVRLYDRGLFEPVIDRVLPLDEIAGAHRALERREVFGKVVVVP